MKSKLKLLYVSNINAINIKGYAAKISGQVQSLNNNGIDVTVCSCDNLSTEIKYVNSSLSWRLALLKNVLEVQRSAGVNHIYFRYSPFDPILIIVTLILKIFRKCDIVLEVPTYPYFKHIIKSKPILKGLVQLFFDFISRPFVVLSVSRIILVSNDRSFLLGVPVLKIRNGVDVNIYPKQNYCGFSVKAIPVINLLFVGNESFYHGLDILLEGLKIYKAKGLQSCRKVHFTLVGTILQKTKDRIHANGIDDMVSIENPKFGRQLDEFFDKATICIGTLASKRLSHFPWSPLKHREYASRGIPFVFDGNDPDFENLDFVFKISDYENTVDISEIVAFVDTVRNVSNNNVALQMRKFTERSLGWDKAQESLIKYYHTRSLEI
jgi:hypothetical protein